MTKLQIESIRRILKKKGQRGYFIQFEDGREIWLTKRRTIPALLLLIRYGEGCEADLQRGSERLAEIKQILEGKYPPNWIQDSYADANKPFSELWNEEGFSWIENRPGDKRLGSQRYVLRSTDYEKLFDTNLKKAHRTAPKKAQKEAIRLQQKGRCNLCRAKLLPAKKIPKHSFSRDRIREVFDHRVPVEKNGTSNMENFQALCFYCNKSKWQICNICTEQSCATCALAYPESFTIVKPTGEDIVDRMVGQ